ncbi:MAG: hypothetical protein K2X27_08335 [Candidatus Obscuribacterales bacterium]|nr:hypothetical protein [Candidatus Obscuribacterales bacterium]
MLDLFESSKIPEPGESRTEAEERHSSFISDSLAYLSRKAAALPDETQWRWQKPKGLLDKPLELNLTHDEKDRIGKKIWQNESGGLMEGLTAWNKGEEFPSLGIGHFIWMPKNVNTPFGESFPEAMNYLKDHGANLPSWLNPDKPCPWDTRKEFLNDFNGKELSELRKFLSDTVALQTDYIIDRLQKALPRILDKVDPALQQKVQDRFYKVLNSSPSGVFALADYLNFKGEGLELVPQYKNHAWGLRQVLEGMKDGADPVKDFSESAKEVLSLRVKNSPPSRNEQQWLKGWHNRVERYVSDPPFMELKKKH